MPNHIQSPDRAIATKPRVTDVKNHENVALPIQVRRRLLEHCNRRVDSRADMTAGSSSAIKHANYRCCHKQLLEL